MQLPANIKSKHFLICDDYESMQAMIIDSLNSLGVTKITVASSGNGGYKTILEKLASDPIEFVMTDLMMEDGTGIDLVKQIRADGNAQVKGLPILMVTSKSEVNFVLESIKAGVNSYIVKPWSIEDLHKRIMEVDTKASK
jgi:two-component system chemotaxis response regulator CheY